MKRILVVAALGAAVALSGCANTAHYEALKVALEQQGKLDVEREKSRQAESAARTARADAIKVGMGKGDIAATVGVAMLAAADIVKEGGGGHDPRPEPVNPILAALSKPPEDILDKTLRIVGVFSRAAADVATVASPWMLARENGRTQRYLADANVNLESARQTGETSRVIAISGDARQVATTLASRAPTNNTTTTTTTTNSAGRDLASDRSTLTNTQVTCTANGGQAGNATATGGTDGTTPSTATGAPAGSASNNC